MTRPSVGPDFATNVGVRTAISGGERLTGWTTGPASAEKMNDVQGNHGDWLTYHDALILAQHNQTTGVHQGITTDTMAASSNVTIGGTLGVTGLSTLASLAVTAAAQLNGGAKFKSAAPGNDTLAGFINATTFTPTITFSVSGSVTYTTQTGTYLRIGNIVFFTLNIGFNKVSGSGDVRVGAFPYKFSTNKIVGISGLNYISSSSVHGAPIIVLGQSGQTYANIEGAAVSGSVLVPGGAAQASDLTTGFNVLEVLGFYFTTDPF